MVFSMNVFKNKKRWQNKKNVKNVPWIKNVKTFFTSMLQTFFSPCGTKLIAKKWQQYANSRTGN